MKKSTKKLLCSALAFTLATTSVFATAPTTQAETVEVVVDSEAVAAEEQIIIHAKGTGLTVYAWQEKDGTVSDEPMEKWPGTYMTEDATMGSGWCYATIPAGNNFIISEGGANQSENITGKEAGEYWYVDGILTDYNPEGPTKEPTATPEPTAAPLEIKAVQPEDNTVLKSGVTQTITVQSESTIGDKAMYYKYALTCDGAKVGDCYYSKSNTYTFIPEDGKTYNLTVYVQAHDMDNTTVNKEYVYTASTDGTVVEPGTLVTTPPTNPASQTPPVESINPTNSQSPTPTGPNGAGEQGNLVTPTPTMDDSNNNDSNNNNNDSNNNSDSNNNNNSDSNNDSNNNNNDSNNNNSDSNNNNNNNNSDSNNNNNDSNNNNNDSNNNNNDSNNNNNDSNNNNNNNNSDSNNNNNNSNNNNSNNNNNNTTTPPMNTGATNPPANSTATQTPPAANQGNNNNGNTAATVSPSAEPTKKPSSSGSTTSTNNGFDQDSDLTITLEVDKVSPQKAGTTLNLSATAEGGEGDYEYYFYYKRAGSSGTIQKYSSENTCTWTPKKSGTYSIYATVKDASNITVITCIKDFKITGLSTSVSVNKKSPQRKGTVVKVKASAANAVGTPKYQFIVKLNGKVKKKTGFGNVKTFAWKPNKAGRYKLYVKVKDANTTITKTKTFVIKK